MASLRCYSARAPSTSSPCAPRAQLRGARKASAARSLQRDTCGSRWAEGRRPAAAASDGVQAAEPPRQEGDSQQQYVDRAVLDAAIERAVRRLGGATNSADLAESDLQEAIHRAIDEEVHTAFEAEMAKLHETPMKLDVTANVNTLMAINAIIALWRGVGGLLDILLEDSLEGYVACIAFGVGVIWLIRVLKLPVVEGNGLPF